MGLVQLEHLYLRNRTDIRPRVVLNGRPILHLTGQVVGVIKVRILQTEISQRTSRLQPSLHIAAGVVRFLTIENVLLVGKTSLQPLLLLRVVRIQKSVYLLKTHRGVRTHDQTKRIPDVSTIYLVVVHHTHKSTRPNSSSTSKTCLV
jgi:hypothetical protein